MRDYIKEPLKRGEIPDKQILEELYIHQCNSLQWLCKYFNRDRTTVRKYLRHYDIQKTNEQIKQSREKTCMEKFGCKHHFSNKQIQQKRKQTFIDKYGVDNPFKSEQIKQKIIKDNLQKYGVENSHQRKDVIEKTRYTNLNRYGETAPSKNNQIKEKIKQTNQRLYGGNSPMCSDLIKQKVRATNLDRYGGTSPLHNDEIKKKAVETNLKRYGVINSLQLEEVKQKRIQTCRQKYNVDYACQHEDVKRKIDQSTINHYGVRRASQLAEIREKAKQTCLKTHGVEHIAKLHIPTETLELMSDVNRFEEFIKDKNYTVNELSNKLGVSCSHVGKYISRHHLHKYIDIYTSRFEEELKSIFPQFYKTKSVIPPYEIDLYNDDIRVGIEFNGNYWHSDINKERLYHQKKSKYAEERGVFLYHIFEYEWTTKRSIVIANINNLLGNNTKIYGRNCDIRQIDTKLCNEFLNNNHLQGKDNSSVRLGLFYDNKLVSVMTFCKPRFNKQYQWELSRYCSLADVTVIGGSSKLFKWFITQYSPSNIVSYSDIGKTRGNMYSMLGFTLQSISSPNYVWFKGDNLLTRYQCQKHKLTEFYNLGSTETEIMENRGYIRIYDCGNKVWAWNRPS